MDFRRSLLQKARWRPWEYALWAVAFALPLLVPSHALMINEVAIVFKLLQDALSTVTPQYWMFWIGLILVLLVLVGRDRLLRPWTWFGARGSAKP